MRYISLVLGLKMIHRRKLEKGTITEKPNYLNEFNCSRSANKRLFARVWLDKTSSVFLVSL